MNRTAKKIIVAAAITALSLQSAPIASACGGRGGRTSYAPVYGGYARASSNYRATLPATPPLYNTHRTLSQPTYRRANQGVSVNRPAATVAAVQPRPRDQVAIQTAASTQQVVMAKPVSNSTSTGDAETSALAALASIASAATSSSSQQPATQQPATQQPATQQTVPQFTSAPVAASATTAAHIGVFTAALPSNVKIELRLNRGNTFSWIVRNNGKTTQFSGQYRIAAGRLTLVRSNDLQQMAGKLTAGKNGFTFKLDGTNNGGLNFIRV